MNDSAGQTYAKLFLTGKHKGSLGQKAVCRVDLREIYGPYKEQGRLKKKKMSRESSRFVYRRFTGLFEVC